MTKMVVIGKEDHMPVTEAQAIHDEIVQKVQDVRELLVRMELENGWAALGFDSWEEYLVDLGRATGSSSKYLRRVSNAGLLEADTGHDVGTFREGTVRPISETLSDAKGFNAGQRSEALELAIDLAGSEEDVTATVAQTAAWYIVVVNKVPDGGGDLVRRMKAGLITPKLANEICQIMRSDRAAGIEGILAMVSDVQLANTMVNLHSTNGEEWREIKEAISTLGFMPTRNGQVFIGDATNEDLIGYLNEPARLQRFEQQVERSELHRQIARAAAALMVDYYGARPSGLPEALTLDDEAFKKERELYQLCQEAGLILNGTSH